MLAHIIMFFRHTLRAMLGILGIQVILEEDKSSKTDRPNVLVANYTSVLDHFAIDVVINNIVVSKLKLTYSLLFACLVIISMKRNVQAVGLLYEKVKIFSCIDKY